MDTLEILPDSNSQIGTIHSHFFQLFQALIQAGEQFVEEAAVPSSTAALRGEEAEICWSIRDAYCDVIGDNRCLESSGLG